VTHRDSNPKDAPEKPETREAEEPAENRKERVIHTRVPAVLEQELKRLAENIRVPVSNLVRTILEDAVEMADRAGRGVEEELHKAATHLSSKRERILQKKREVEQRRPLEGVIGFQAMRLAADARCARCERAIDEGEDAHLGVSADPTAPRVVVCNECVPRGRGKEEKKP
jgi:hypothetical protein